MRLTVNGLCPCGGKLRSSEWETKTHRKGRTTCNSCGRTELKEERINGKIINIIQTKTHASRY